MTQHHDSTGLLRMFAGVSAGIARAHGIDVPPLHDERADPEDGRERIAHATLPPVSIDERESVCLDCPDYGGEPTANCRQCCGGTYGRYAHA